MFLKVFRHFIHICWYFVAFSIISLACLLSIARLSMPLINHHRGFVDQKVSRWLAHPVSIGHIDAVWHGFEPMVRLNDVSIRDSNQKPLLHVDQLQVGLDLLSSIRHWKMIPSLMMLSGTTISLAAQADGSVYVVGFHDNHSSVGEASKTQALLAWLFSQRHIQVDNVLVDWAPLSGTGVSVFVKQIDARGDLLHHTLSASISTGQTVNPQVSVHIGLEGNLNQLPTVSGHFYLDGKSVPVSFLSSLIGKNSWKGWTPVNGIADIQCWVDMSEQKIQSFQAQLGVHQLIFQSPQVAQNVSVKALTGTWLWAKNSTGGWQLQGQDINLELPSGVVPMFVNVAKLNATSPLMSTLSIDAIHLEDLDTLMAGFVVANPGLVSLQTAWSHLKPQGLVKNLVIQQDGSAEASKSIALSATFSDMGVDRWRNIPGVSHLSGQGVWKDSQGYLSVDSKNTTLDLGGQFVKPFQFDQFSAALGFSKNEQNVWALSLHQLVMRSPEIHVNADGALLFNDDPRLTMLAHFTLPKASDIRDFLPLNATSPGLQVWLQKALSGGQLEGEAAFKEFSFDHEGGSFLVQGHVNNLNLHYADGWPDITDLKTAINFNGHDIRIEANSGLIGELPIKKITALIPIDKVPAVLRVHAQGQGDSSQAIHFLLSSPLKDSFEKTSELFNIQGPMDLTADLSMPLSGDHITPQVTANFHVTHNTLQLSAYPVSMTDLLGDLTLKEGVIASQLTGLLFNNPATLAINSNTVDKKLPTLINLSGRISSKDLQPLGLAPPFDQWIDGSTAFHLVGTFPSGSEQVSHLVFTSDLKGLSFIKLPPPFAKKAETTVPLMIDLGLGLNSSKTLLARLGSLAEVNYRWQGDQPSGGVVHLGPGVAQQTDKPGLWITGDLAVVDWLQWSPVIDDFKTNSKNQQGLLKNINVHMQEFLLYNQTLKKATLDATPTPQGMKTKIDSDMVEGSLLIPSDTQQEWPGHFKRLFLVGHSKSVGASEPPLDPTQLPLFNITADDFKYNHTSYGHAALQLGALPQGRMIKKLTLISPNLNLNIREGRWLKMPDGMETQLSGHLTSDHVGTMLKSWGVDSHVIMHQGALDFNLSWNNAPYLPSLETMSGNGAIALGSGEITHLGEEASSKLEQGKLLNILSLSSPINRLKDLSSKGYVFDKMTSSFTMVAGTLETEDTVLEATVGDIYLNGRIGLASHDYNMNVIVKPTVAGSLPLIAGVVGGPLAFGITWVASKAVNAAVGDAAKVSYHLGGTWNDPVFAEANLTTGASVAG